MDGSMASDPMGHPFGGKQMMKTPAFSKGISYRGFFEGGMGGVDINDILFAMGGGFPGGPGRGFPGGGGRGRGGHGGHGSGGHFHSGFPF